MEEQIFFFFFSKKQQKKKQTQGVIRGPVCAERREVFPVFSPAHCCLVAVLCVLWVFVSSVTGRIRSAVAPGSVLQHPLKRCISRHSSTWYGALCWGSQRLSLSELCVVHGFVREVVQQVVRYPSWQSLEVGWRPRLGCRQVAGHCVLFHPAVRVLRAP